MIVGEKTVHHSNGSYPVFLSEEFKGLSSEVQKIPNVTSIVVFTERNIAQLYLKYLEKELLNIGIPLNIIYIKEGEKNKHIDRVKEAYNELIDLGVDRKCLILALGGGVVGDFSGFISATYQRGVRFVQIPTTLLAAVDSSVGGKVAVNLDKGKNMVGVFHHPEMVFMPMFTLSTLSNKDWRCGFAEIAKHCLLKGGKMWEDFVSHSRKDMNHKSEVLVRMILDSIEFKSSVVSKDEKESNLRQILNLGHTTAHAIESFTRYKMYSHGEAVSIGIITELYLSSDYANFPKDKIKDIADSMSKYNLPVKDQSKAKEIVEHMEYDKKKEGNQLKFSLLEDIGKPVFGIPIERSAFLKAWKEQSSMN